MSARQELGDTVVDGVPQYTSASQLKLADQTSETGCLRAWFYQYVLKFKPPQTPALTAGSDLHEEIEEYHFTGVPTLTPLAMSGRHMMFDASVVAPRSRPVEVLSSARSKLVHIEYPLVPWVNPLRSDGTLIGPLNPARADLSRAVLHADGIPVVGYIDVLNETGDNRGVPDAPEIRDSEDVLEILDWKSTSNVRYAKRGSMLLDELQMVGYGRWALMTRPWVRRVRLSHGYFPKKGAKPFKTTIVVSRDTLDEKWEHADRVARSIREASRAASPEQVPANTRACHRYNQTCFHRSYCSAEADVDPTLAELIGTTAAEDLLVQIRPRTSDLKTGDTVTTENNAPEGSLNNILGAAASPAKPAVDPAELAAEARNPKLHQTIRHVVSYGKGMVALGGELAAAYSMMHGKPPADGYAGNGDLAKYTLVKMDQLEGLLKEIPIFFKTPELPVPTLLAPVATPAAPATAPAALLSSDIPEATKPVTLAPAPVADAASAIADVTDLADTEPTKDEPAKGGRKRKVKDAAPVAQAAPAAPVETVPTTAPIAPAASAPVETAATTAPVAPAAPAPVATLPVVYIDAIPSCASESLWPTVHRLLHDLGVKTNSPNNDPRLAGENSPVGFSRWKAMISAFIVDAGLPASGHFVIDNTFSDLGQAAVEGYRRLAIAGKCLLVRGTR